MDAKLELDVNCWTVAVSERPPIVDHCNLSHRLERVVPTGPITMFQLLIGLIQSRDNRGRHVLSSETTEVDGYENGLMPVFRSCLKSAYADF